MDNVINKNFLALIRVDDEYSVGTVARQEQGNGKTLGKAAVRHDGYVSYQRIYGIYRRKYI